jgi:hypothetical protein
MNILTTIKNIFSKTQPNVTNPVVSYDIEAYLAKHTKGIEEEAKLFIDKYGSDFDIFFYRQKFDIFIRKEILPFRQPNSKKLSKNGIYDHHHVEKWIKRPLLWQEVGTNCELQQTQLV